MNDELNFTIRDVIEAVGIQRITQTLRIPYRTLQNWLYGKSEPAPYVTKLLASYYDVDRRLYSNESNTETTREGRKED